MLRNSPFSPQTTSLLSAWLSRREEIKTFPYAVHKELASYCPPYKTSRRLYRCLTSPLPLTKNIHSMQVFSDYTSWTYNAKIAEEFAREGEEKMVITSLIPSAQFLVDTTLIPPSVIKDLDGFPDEEEVIVKPGVYFVQLA